MTAPQPPTRHQMLETTDAMHDFSRTLRGLAVMIEDGGEPHDPEFTGALRVVANRLDGTAAKIADDDPDTRLTPGDTTLPDMAALLLATLWDCGGEGFKSSVALLMQVQGETEGKS